MGLLPFSYFRGERLDFVLGAALRRRCDIGPADPSVNGKDYR
jgi:hypothetical protein